MNIVLPFPPVTGNHMWKHAKGKHYLVKEAKDYYADVMMAVQMQGAHLNTDEKLRLQVLLYPPDNRRRDMDNAWKVIGDAMTKAGVWLDDSQIRAKLIEWQEPVKGGRVLVNLARYVENPLTS